MNAFIVQKAQFEVFYRLEILMYIEFQFKIDILLSILLCIWNGNGEYMSLMTCRLVLRFKYAISYKMHVCISNGYNRCIQISRRDSTWNAEPTNQGMLHLKFKTAYNLQLYLIYYFSCLFTWYPGLQPHIRDVSESQSPPSKSPPRHSPILQRPLLVSRTLSGGSSIARRHISSRIAPLSWLLSLLDCHSSMACSSRDTSFIKRRLRVRHAVCCWRVNSCGVGSLRGGFSIAHSSAICVSSPSFLSCGNSPVVDL